MKHTFSPLSITSRLFLLLLIFVITFYGTLLNVFIRIQEMVVISEEIVGINNEIASQSKILLERLIEMDGYARRHTLVGSELYRDQFAAAQNKFNTSLQAINHLTARGYTAPSIFSLFLDEYTAYTFDSQQQVINPSDIIWVDRNTYTRWLGMLNQFRDANQENISKGLMRIHELTQQTTRNGLLGLLLSIFISLIGVWYIAGSLITPLKQLTRGLRSLPLGGSQPASINVDAPGEFHDLANAYNEMHSELTEQENLRADFIASLSHEIRTPLSSIQESVNMLVEEVLGDINDKQRKFLTISSQELARINGLLNQLMDVSMLTTSPSEEKIARRIDPRRAVLNCIAALSGLASQKQISLIENSQPNCGEVRGRPDEFQQVLLNIISNGIKFSPAGSTITVQIVRNDSEDQLDIQVSDQGPGVAEAELSLIFKKYYRSNVVRKHMDGVGLGLYISSRIVHSMGGTISVKNNPEAGCTFTIRLPLA